MIEYRFLDSDDTLRFEKIVELFRHQKVDDDKALSILNNPSILVGLANKDEDICGYTLSYRLPRMDNGNDMMLIYHCFVAEGYKRQGVATRMINMLLEYAKEHDLHYVFLITQEDNEAANSLYQKLGGELHPSNRNLYYWYFTGRPKL